MVDIKIQPLLSYIFLLATLVIELVSFLTSHMIDGRFLPNLHEGIFQRCTFQYRYKPTKYHCYWWTDDTFRVDGGEKKINF